MAMYAKVRRPPKLGLERISDSNIIETERAPMSLLNQLGRYLKETRWVESLLHLILCIPRLE